MLEVGAMLARPPPAGSPASNMLEAYGAAPVQARPARCGHCLAEGAAERCSGCKEVR